MTTSKTSLCALLLTAAAGSLFVSNSAAASSVRDTSAGGACHALNSTAKFTFSNNYLVNTGTNDQYVVCHFQMNDDSSVALSHPSNLDLSMTAGSTPGTVLCGAQEGSYFGGVNTIISSTSSNFTMAAGTNRFFNFNAGALVRTRYWDTLTLSCRVPAGFTMGLIEWTEG